MRNLSERSNGDYLYVRDFSAPLLKASPSHPKQFSKELGLNTCSDSELLKAMGEATRLYDLRVKTASNSDPNAFSESELKMAVEEVHRQRNWKAGECAHVPESQYTQEEFERAMEHGAVIVPDKFDLAEQSTPEVEDAGNAEQRGEKLTFQQQVYVDAWKAVQHLPTIRKSWVWLAGNYESLST